MKSYLAAVPPSDFVYFRDFFPDIKLNILISWDPLLDCSQRRDKDLDKKCRNNLMFYLKCEEARNGIESLILDSGVYAFAMRKIEQPNTEKEFSINHNIENYKQFISRHAKDCIDFNFNYDDMFESSKEAVNNNLLKWNDLISHGYYKTVPVIHDAKQGGEGLLEPDVYLNSKTDIKLIAFGSTSDVEDSVLRPITQLKLKTPEWAIEKVKMSGKLIHILGVGSRNLGEHPVDSCDSVNWKIDTFRPRKVQFLHDGNIYSIPVDEGRYQTKIRTKKYEVHKAFEHFLMNEFVNKQSGEHLTLAKYFNDDQNHRLVSMYYYAVSYPAYINMKHDENYNRETDETRKIMWKSEWPESILKGGVSHCGTDDSIKISYR